MDSTAVGDCEILERRDVSDLGGNGSDKLAVANELETFYYAVIEITRHANPVVSLVVISTTADLSERHTIGSTRGRIRA